MFLRYFSLYRDTIAEISEGDAGFNIHGEKAFYVLLGNTYRMGIMSHQNSQTREKKHFGEEERKQSL